MGIKVKTSDQEQPAGVCEYFLFEVVSKRDAFQMPNSLNSINAVHFNLKSHDTSEIVKKRIL